MKKRSNKWFWIIGILILIALIIFFLVFYPKITGNAVGPTQRPEIESPSKSTGIVPQSDLNSIQIIGFTASLNGVNYNCVKQQTVGTWKQRISTVYKADGSEDYAWCVECETGASGFAYCGTEKVRC